MERVIIFGTIALTVAVNAPLAVAQTEIPEDCSKIFTCIHEEVAHFPGGMQGLGEWIVANMRYPEEARKNGERGRVIVRFAVNEDGSVSDIKILRGVSKSLDAEAIRMVKSMPKWKPGKLNGKVVRSYYLLPIIFTKTE